MKSGLSAVIGGCKPTLSAPVLFFLVVIVICNSLFVGLMSIDSGEATNNWVLKFSVRMQLKDAIILTLISFFTAFP